MGRALLVQPRAAGNGCTDASALEFGFGLVQVIRISTKFVSRPYNTSRALALVLLRMNSCSDSWNETAGLRAVLLVQPRLHEW